MSKILYLPLPGQTSQNDLLEQIMAVALQAWELDPQIAVGITYLCSLQTATGRIGVTKDKHHTQQEEIVKKFSKATQKKITRLPIPIPTSTNTAVTAEIALDFFKPVEEFIRHRKNLLLVFGSRGAFFYPQKTYGAKKTCKN